MLAEVAVLAVTAGMKTRAIRFAKEALAADPDNEKARRILDEIEGHGAKGGSLLGRLRGRS